MRRVDGAEPSDRRSRALLLALPIAIVVLFLICRWQLRQADALIAAFALLGAALIAVFPQLASWRQRLTERRRRTETVTRSAIDEAVALVLMSSLISLLGAAVGVVSLNVPAGAEDGSWPDVTLFWAHVALSGLTAGLGLNVLLSSVVAINLLWDAYCEMNEIDDAEERQTRSTAA